MTILLNQAVRVGGSVLAAATTQTLAADLEADLVQRKMATYISNPADALSDVPVRAKVNPLTGVIELSPPGIGTQAYTWATLPSASAQIGQLAFVTDINGGTFFRSNGTHWKPYNNIAVLKALGDRVTMTGTSEFILAQVALPAGIMQNGDNLRIRQSLSKSSTAETATLRLRLGTFGSTGDTTIWANASLATASISAGYDLSFKRKAAAEIIKTGSGSTLQPFTGVSTAAYASPVTVANMDSSDMFLSLTCASSAGVETIALEDFVCELLSK